MVKTGEPFGAPFSKKKRERGIMKVWYETWSREEEKRIYSKLERFNRKYEGFGIEVIRAADIWDRFFGSTALLYVNMGDTYVKTYAFSPVTGKFYRGDLENILMRLPKFLEKKIF